MSTPAALQQTTTVVQSAAQLAGVVWDQVEAADLPAAAADLARAKAMLDAALVAVAGRLQATDAATEQGWASAKDFLTHLTGGRKGAGGGLVRAAEQTRDLPQIRTALAAGEISLAQARVIAGRVATLPRVEELRTGAADRLLDRVQQHGYDATDLDRTFPDVVRELDPDGALLGNDLDKPRQERGAHSARFLSFAADALGGVRIKGYATLEDAELVKTALMPLAAPQTTEPGACGGNPATFGKRDDQGRRIDAGCPTPGCAHDGTDPRDSGARMWDALLEACDRLARTDNLPHAHGASARIYLTLDYEHLRHRLAAAGLPTNTSQNDTSRDEVGDGLLPSGDTLSATAVRRLACDAEIIPAVLGAEGQILDLGRTTRLVSTALWLALVLRDQHCAFPGCTRLPIACDAHHITHWADGGSTSLDNLVMLCRRHHTTTHHTPWTVHIHPDTRQPVWTPPPLVDDSNRFTYRPPIPPPNRPGPPGQPLVA